MRQALTGVFFRPGDAIYLDIPPSSRLFISKSEYSISDIISIFEYLNYIFMLSISNRILSGIVETIRIRFRIDI